MTKQDQRVSEGGVAFQSGGNLTVTQGYTPDQMAEVMVALANQLKGYFSAAEQTFAERCEEFKAAVLEKFSTEKGPSNPDAFADPDFQFALRSAQDGFGRKGTDELKTALVSLLSQRSSHQSASRSASVLNDAILMAPKLGSEEYATLATVFVFLHVRLGANNQDMLFSKMSRISDAVVDHLREDGHCIDYLSSLSCLSVIPISAIEWTESIRLNYAPYLSFGVPDQEIAHIIAGEHIGINMKEVAYRQETREGRKIFFVGADDEFIASRLRAAGYSEQAVERVQSERAKVAWSPEDLKRELPLRVARSDELSRIWNKTALGSARLTAVGKVLAHSWLVANQGFDGELDIWVK